MIDPLTQVMGVLDPSGRLQAAVEAESGLLQRDAVTEAFEGHAVWREDDASGGRWWIPVDTAVDVVLDARWKP